MKCVIQRTKTAKVVVENNVVGQIEKGFLILLGVTHTDTEENVDKMVDKILKLRIFNDENGKMNLDIFSIGGEILLVSQFTLYADSKKGNRPSFVDAAKPEHAERLYEYMKKRLSEKIHVECGIFGADMEVNFVNEGPVTIIIEDGQ